MGANSFHRRTDHGAVLWRGLVVFLLLAVAAGALLLYFFGQVVPPGSVGIRQIAFGPYKGFSARALKPGYHWVVPYYSRIYLIPQTVQVIDFHREGAPSEVQPLEVPTADRAMVDVDVSVLVRFEPSNKVLGLGVEPAAWDRAIRTSARTALRMALSELVTSQFYNPEQREPKLLAATSVMREELGPRGVEVQGVLLRRYTYEAGLEDSIFKKNLEELKRELSMREAEYAKAEGEVENVKSEFNGAMVAVKEDGEKSAQVIRSSGELYEAEKRAAGDLLVANVKAEIDRQRVAALAKAEGASVYVARELAPLLGSLRGGVIRGMDPYDLDAWAARLGVKEGK